MKKSVALFVLAILPALSCVRQNTLVVDMLPEETWWGGFDNPNSWQIKGDYSFPFDASMEFEVDFSANNYSNNIVYNEKTKGKKRTIFLTFLMVKTKWNCRNLHLK